MTLNEARAAYPILVFFSFAHLPDPLKRISAPFADLAVLIATGLPQCAETSTALRKLLEAKDCAVRAELAGGHGA